MKLLARLTKANGGKLVEVDIPDKVLGSLPPEVNGFTWTSKIKGLSDDIKSKYTMIYIPTK